ncbi:ABC transporter permease [Massilia sp. 9I]|uniref:ABC transporter permease n=1 Tax=Massilia sp. 9I TaxID=2653152 RepID=UPI0012F23D75|nr:ABC transporter permease [Massilia sp. 9I]VXB82384.1 Alkanesulfonates transport system permease protein [Massilia sp. 9I]
MKTPITAIAAPLRGLLLPLLLLLAWEWASGLGAGAAYVFVPLGQLWDGAREMLADGSLVLHVRASLERALTGLVAGALLGIATGTLMAQSRVAERLVGPLFHSIRQVPLLGLVPLIALWAGSGEFAKLLIIGIAALYPTVLNTFEGMRQVDLRYREVGAMLTFSRAQMFRHVLLPGALPAIITGVTHAQVFAWLACLGGELLFAAAPGIGSLLQTSEQAGRMDVVLLSVLVIALLAQVLNLVFTRAARLLVRGRSVQ